MATIAELEDSGCHRGTRVEIQQHLKMATRATRVAALTVGVRIVMFHDRDGFRRFNNDNVSVFSGAAIISSYSVDVVLSSVRWHGVGSGGLKFGRTVWKFVGCVGLVCCCLLSRTENKL